MLEFFLSIEQLTLSDFSVSIVGMDFTEYFWNYYTSVILKRVFFLNNFVLGVIQNSQIKRIQEARNEESRNGSSRTTNDRLEQLPFQFP